MNEPMGSSTSKFSWVIFIFIVSVFCIGAAFGTETNSTTAGKSLHANPMEDIFNPFMRQSRRIRLGLVYAGVFFSEEDRIRLYELAQKASSGLERLYDQQQQQRKRIEEYQGDDWDELYGVTGLWRKIRSDELATLWFKCRADRFLAASSEQKERPRISRDILARCDFLEGKLEQSKLDLLKAGTLALPGTDNLKYKMEAKKLLKSIIDNEQTGQIYFEAGILELSLAEKISKKHFEKILRQIRQSKWKDDPELNLKLGLLGLKAKNPEPLRQAVKRWRQWAEKPAGQILFMEMAYQQQRWELTEEVLREKSNFEIALAAKAVLEAGAAKHKELLEKIYRIEKFQLPAVLYAMGQAYCETKPELAIKYFIRAADKQQKQKDDTLGITPARIALEAAKLGFSLAQKDKKYCGLAEEAVGYYLRTAGEKKDEAIEYSYAKLLTDSGKKNEAKGMLEKIAAKKGIFSKTAKLDLIISRLENRWDNPRARQSIEKGLYELIDESTGDKDSQIRLEATKIYGQLLAEHADENSAQKAITVLAKVVNDNDCELASQAISALSTVIERIDTHAETADDPESFLKDCKTVADFCLNCTEGDRLAQIELIWAEIAIFSAGMDKDKLNRISNILSKTDGYDDNIDRLRCHARLLEALGRNAASARLWGQICTARKPTKRTQKRPRQWWRGKYHELSCSSKLPGTNISEIIHAVEILENSFDDIPGFWAGKFAVLKAELIAKNR